ncbi:branched-chain amino acid ABC transporter permease [Miniimonas arenae]|uniref:Branched-chain amino acid ABC transporter permease n=1 Tax=Miniimonas arenae TaxID=676201 RepID=A0A5C5BDZ3_9MICO|nr:AzlC family ABC transporter permease [Miniimonas arenae]TNU74131.1 branched-chain amino acid ABC transporter permease [Miniimonas arenae]
MAHGLRAIRALWHDVPRDLRRPILLMSLAVALVGVTYGVTGVSAGFAAWQLLLLALTVLAGSAELLFVGLVGAGASPWLAAAAGILVNLRNSVYGMAVSPLLPRGWRRALGAHLVNDETVAFATSPAPAAAPVPTAHRGRVATFWVAGIGVALGWPVGAAVGAGLGLVVSDPRVWGLDAVLPALLGALAVPAIRAGRTLAVAVLAAVIALVTTPLVPAGLAPVLALAALAVVLVPGRSRPAQSDAPGGLA